ncbi:MAG TPA: AmmeMemoRadiSam system radical SAM enzyme [Candidatus Krumholzibacterium sp.]|nr:AmmeMemoRadiSam system radical SAM enzyme [Candidatus Krumholzibacterium sp.]
METKEALYYEKLSGGDVRCVLCPNHCHIGEGRQGRCGLRDNEGGVLIARSYGNTVTLAIDPVEKKPLYHFLPGTEILSIGPNGCTLTCDHCQNWSISQVRAPVRYIPPGELPRLARENGCASIAFTYTEPLLWYEYLIDALPLLRKTGVRSVLVTNGYLDEEPARRIIPLVDAFNVDLKGFTEEFYRDVCGGSLEPVKRFIEIAAGRAHVEVTTLVIPGLNDSAGEIERLAQWLAGVSREIPFHLSRFHPGHRMMDRDRTSERTMLESYEIARRFLDYVYLGNIFIEGTSGTVCPGCGQTVIKRIGYSVGLPEIPGRCGGCGRDIKGVWE